MDNAISFITTHAGKFVISSILLVEEHSDALFLGFWGYRGLEERGLGFTI